MDDIDRSKKSRKRNDEKRYDDIAEAIKIYLEKCHVSSTQYVAQENRMKEVQKHFIDSSILPPLKQREIVQVKILNGISPKELFVLKTIDKPTANQFHRDFDRDYVESQHESVFCLKTGIFCAAKTASNGWQRCRILRLHTKSMCTVFLMDIGLNEHIKWIDLRMLDVKWCRQNPFAIRCSLIDLISANLIDRYSLQQQQQFTKLLQMHEDFYISVHRSGTISSDIYLYYVLDNRFHCVNEIFPSNSASTDDEGDDESDDVHYETEDTILPRSRAKLAASGVNGGGSDAVMHSAGGSTFIVNRSANEVSVMDANQNEVKKENTTNGNEKKESSYRDVEPKKQPPPLNQPLRLSEPEVIIVQHIDETGVIFVNFKKHKKALNALRFEIQKQMRYSDENGVQSNNTDLAWSVNDYCLIHAKFEGIPEWLRGKITHVSTAAAAAAAIKNGDNLAQVYLRDIGKIVEVPLRKLRRASIDSIQNVRDFAFKLRLAFIEFKQLDDQPPWIVKVLKRILTEYDEIAISFVGATGGGGQLNIILWGMNRNVRAMLPEKIDLTNINEELVNLGYALASIDNFDGINNLIGNVLNVSTPDPSPYYDSSDNYQPNSTQSAYKVTEQLKDVAEWLPSEPILQREFTASPMYVSHKCVLSVLEANRYTVADQMKKILEKKDAANELERRAATEWKKEDPCFVRFAGDKKFYRGSVRRVNLEKNSCMVRFIDYGNCEACKLDDLRKANMFGNIPVLSRLYQLDNIRPLTENGTWPEQTRKYCLANVVERHFNLIVTDDLAATKSHDEPTLCKLELFTKDKDLASALVALKLAQWIRPITNDKTA